MVNRELLKEQHGRQQSLPATKRERDAQYYKQQQEQFRKSGVYRAYSSTPGLLAAGAFDVGFRDPNIRKGITGAIPGGAGAGIESAIAGPGSLPIGATYLGLRGVSNINRAQRLAYERQHANELGMAGKVSRASDTFSNLNRLAYTMPLGYSMMAKGAGLTGATWGGPSLWGAMGNPAMAGVIGAGVAAGMLKGRKLGQLAPAKKGSQEIQRDYSVADRFDSEISQLASQGQLQGKDQLYLGLLQAIEGHTSGIRHIAMILDFWDQSKDPKKLKASERGYKEIEKPEEKRSLLDHVEKFATTSTLKYDPMGQLLNFLATGKTPKRMLEDIEKAYPDKDKRRYEQRQAIETGTPIQGVRLLHTKSQDILATATTYESKMLNLARAQLDATLMSARNLVAIRQAMGVEKEAFAWQEVEKQSMFSRMLSKLDDLATSIPGVAALYQVARLPYDLSQTIGRGLGAIGDFGRTIQQLPVKFKDWLSGGLFSAVRDPRKMEQEMGIYETPQELAYSFLGQGFPEAVSQSLMYDETKIKLLRNIYQVLSEAHGIQADTDDLASQRQIVWDDVAKKFTTEPQRQQLLHGMRLEYAKDRAGGWPLLNWIKSQITGRDVDDIERENVRSRLERVGMTEDDLYQEDQYNIDHYQRKRTGLLERSPTGRLMSGAGVLGGLAAAPLLPILGPIAAAIAGVAGIGGAFRGGYRAQQRETEWKKQHVWQPIQEGQPFATNISDLFGLRPETEAQPGTEAVIGITETPKTILAQIRDASDQHLTRLSNILQNILDLLKVKLDPDGDITVDKQVYEPIATHTSVSIPAKETYETKIAEVAKQETREKIIKDRTKVEAGDQSKSVEERKSLISKMTERLSEFGKSTFEKYQESREQISESTQFGLKQDINDLLEYITEKLQLRQESSEPDPDNWLSKLTFTPISQQPFKPKLPGAQQMAVGADFDPVDAVNQSFVSSTVGTDPYRVDFASPDIQQPTASMQDLTDKIKYTTGRIKESSMKGMNFIKNLFSSKIDEETTEYHPAQEKKKSKIIKMFPDKEEPQIDEKETVSSLITKLTDKETYKDSYDSTKEYISNLITKLSDKETYKDSYESTKEYISSLITKLSDKKEESKETISEFLSKLIDKKEESKETISEFLNELTDRKKETDEFISETDKFTFSDNIRDLVKMVKTRLTESEKSEYVSGYTRQDGTPVSSYYRKPAYRDDDEIPQESVKDILIRKKQQASEYYDRISKKLRSFVDSYREKDYTSAPPTEVLDLEKSPDETYDYTGQLEDIETQQRKERRFGEKQEQTEQLTGINERLELIKEKLGDDDKKDKDDKTLIGKIFDKVKNWLLLGLGAAGIAALFMTDTGQAIRDKVGEVIMDHPALGLGGLAAAGAATGFMFGGIPGAIVGGLLGGAVGVIMPAISDTDGKMSSDFYRELAEMFKDGLPRAAATGAGVISGAMLGMSVGMFAGPLGMIKGGIVGGILGGIVGFLSGEILQAFSDAIQDDGSFSAWEFIKSLILRRPGTRDLGRELDRLSEAETPEEAQQIVKDIELEADTQLKEIKERREKRDEEAISWGSRYLSPTNMLAGARDFHQERSALRARGKSRQELDEIALRETGQDPEKIRQELREQYQKQYATVPGGAGPEISNMVARDYREKAKEARKQVFGTSDYAAIQEAAEKDKRKEEQLGTGGVDEVVSPVSSNVITSPFGPRPNDKGWSDPHKGIDLRAREGEPIFASMPGKVIFTGGDYGTIAVDHGDDVKTRYMHLSNIKVDDGDMVDAGEKIGQAGGQGPKGPRTYAPHLHYEIFRGDQRIDPEPFLEKVGGLTFDEIDSTTEKGGYGLAKRLDNAKRDDALLTMGTGGFATGTLDAIMADQSSRSTMQHHIPSDANTGFNAEVDYENIRHRVTYDSVMERLNDILEREDDDRTVREQYREEREPETQFVPMYHDDRPMEQQYSQEALTVQNAVEDVMFGQINSLFGFAVNNYRNNIIDYAYGNYIFE